MLYMIVETFRDGDALPVYRRFRDKGRMAPDGLKYVASWVTEDLRRCFQIMECDDPALIAEWMARWEDVTEFDVNPVITSEQAAAVVSPQLYDDHREWHQRSRPAIKRSRPSRRDRVGHFRNPERGTRNGHSGSAFVLSSSSSRQRGAAVPDPRRGRESERAMTLLRTFHFSLFSSI